MVEEWHGENPFFLIIEREGGNAGIDLDQHGWAEVYKEFIRGEGTWHLVHKATGGYVLSVICHEGDQGYYTARHVGRALGGTQHEVIAYGIGKKQADGTMVRLWNVNGTTCGGDDVEELADRVVGMLMAQNG